MYKKQPNNHMQIIVWNGFRICPEWLIEMLIWGNIKVKNFANC